MRINETIHSQMERILEGITWGKLLLSLCGSLLYFLSPIVPFYASIFIFVVCDTFAGMRAAKKRGETITDKRFGRTTEKIFFYLMVVSLAEVLHRQVMPVVPVTYVAASYILVEEFQSIMKHASTITGKNLWDSVAHLFTRFLPSNSNNSNNSNDETEQPSK